MLKLDDDGSCCLDVMARCLSDLPDADEEHARKLVICQLSIIVRVK